jgi:hypothetical protein
MPSRTPSAKSLEPSPAHKRASSARGAGMAATLRLTELVERIAACQGGETYFSEAEIGSWPADLMAALKASRLLSQASPADSLECPGCEEACVMPVHVMPGTGALPGRALIACDKRDDISRVNIPIASLARLKSSGAMLAESLANILFAELARPVALDGHRWQLGQFQGLKHKSPLVLLMDMVPCLVTAGHTVKLTDVLLFKNESVSLDFPALRGMVDNPIGQAAKDSGTLDDRAARVYARVNVLKAKGKKNFNEQVAEEEGLSIATIKNDYKKHADSLKKPKRGASVFNVASTLVSSRKSKI